MQNAEGAWKVVTKEEDRGNGAVASPSSIDPSDLLCNPPPPLRTRRGALLDPRFWMDDCVF